MLRKCFVIITLVSFILLIGGMASEGIAEDTTDRAFDLGKVVVTATKSEKKVEDVTSSVSVIDEEEIEASNANYVMDVISNLPGVYVRKDGIFGRQKIEIRGLGSNGRRIQTLIDGRPEKMALFGCTVTQTLPLANIERIEVVRGPESVLYGSDAMGGVINIITKKRKKEGFESSALASYGSYNTFHSLLSHGGKKGPFDYYLTYDHKLSDGHRDNSEYKGYNLTARLGYQFTDALRIEVSGKHFDDEAEDPGPESNPYTQDDKKEYERDSWDVDLIGEWDRTRFSITFYQNMGEHQFTMPSEPDWWHSKDRTTGLLSKLSLDLFDKGDIKDTLTIGYEYQKQWATTLDPYDSYVKENYPPPLVACFQLGEHSRYNNDVFLFNEFNWAKLVATLGIRFHHDKINDWETIPQVGLLYHILDSTTIRAKISKGFRQPRFSEMYLFPAHNEELEPERVWSYEMGLTHTFPKWVSVSITPFYMDIENFIQRMPNPNFPPPPRFINQNSGEFYIRGIEAGIDIRPFENLVLTLYNTYMDIEDPSDTNHANLQGKPKNVFDAMIKYTWNNLSLSWDGEYVSGLYDENLATGNIEKVDSFFVAGMKGSYWINKYVQVFAGIDNMFDKDYEMIPEYPMPGTTVYAGLRGEF